MIVEGLGVVAGEILAASIAVMGQLHVGARGWCASARGPSYRLALKRAEIACRHMPFKGCPTTPPSVCPSTAWENFRRPSPRSPANRTRPGGPWSPIPADLAFLAMTSTDEVKAGRR